jgi:hypothetical protein
MAFPFLFRGLMIDPSAGRRAAHAAFCPSLVTHSQIAKDNSTAARSAGGARSSRDIPIEI